jgi:hypothetical protein
MDKLELRFILKKFNLILLIFSILLVLSLQSCDDSGVEHGFGPKGKITLTFKNFKHLDQNVDGIYEAWLRLDSAGNRTYYSLGKFNMTPSGQPVDSIGSPMEFKFSGDTNSLYHAAVALITVNPPGTNNNSPGPAHLISTQLTINQDSIYGTLLISGTDALGSAGQQLMYVPTGSSGNHGYFEITTPTGWQSTCVRGIWFGDQNRPFLPDGIELQPGCGWVYEGWVADITNPSNPIYYSTGRFRDPGHADYDAAGPCKGPNQPFDRPGEDWVSDSCSIQGKPPITNLSNGRYQAFISLEPEYETPSMVAYGSPFFLKLFLIARVNPLISCGVLDLLSNQVSTFPSARININN